MKGKFKYSKSAYFIKTGENRQEWEDYYKERIGLISHKIRELGLHKERVNIIREDEQGYYLIQFPYNGLTCLIHSDEIELVNTIPEHLPEHLFEI